MEGRIKLKLDLFVKLRCTHKQMEKCADLKLDYRYLIQKLVNLGSNNFIADSDRPRPN